MTTRRQFTKRSVLGLAAITLTGGAWKCGSEKVTIYIQTISAFLNELKPLLPGQVGIITTAINVAADFDAAYRRGDFANASTFFNTLVGNVTELTNTIGINLSPQVKTLLSVVSITIRTVAVLLQQQATPATITAARASQPAAVKLIEQLAAPEAVNAAFQAARLRQ